MVDTATRERPILFSTPMVRAILDGRKTQTRRVVTNATSRGNYRASDLLLDDPFTFADPGPSPAGNPGHYLHAKVNAPEIERRHGWSAGDCDPTVIERLYPFVFAGDRLWVREGFRAECAIHLSEYRLNYRATGPSAWGATVDADWCGAAEWHALDEVGIQATRWFSSIHAPRWASRLTLEVTGVRVERLNDISELDAEAECGAAPYSMGDGSVGAFRKLWDSINGKRAPWESNPWVWVISFERVP